MSMLLSFREQDPYSRDLSDNSSPVSWLHKRVALCLEYCLLRLGVIDHQDFRVQNRQVPNEGALWILFHPLRLKLTGQSLHLIQTLSKKKYPILTSSADGLQRPEEGPHLRAGDVSQRREVERPYEDVKQPGHNILQNRQIDESFRPGI